MTLKKTGDQFIGYALFKPDPELDDNPGYYEYFEHYTPATGYCPCVGDGCPLCAEGDNASTRAKTLWYIDGEIKTFNLNYYMIQEFVDLLSEDEAILGQQFRIKRLEGNGKYAIRPKTEKLKATELKKIMKDIDDDQLEKVAMKQLKRVHEELDVEDAMTEDDEDKPKDKKADKTSKSAKKGKPVEEEPEPDEGFDHENEDSAEDLTLTVVKLKKKDNIAIVQQGDGDEFELYGTEDVDLTELTKGDEIVVSFEKDEDGDFVVSELGEAEPEPAEGNDQASVEDETVTITAVNAENETLTVEQENGGSFELYFLGDGEDANGKEWSDLDFDDYSEGMEIVISAAVDEDGDMLASVFPEPVKKGKKTDKKSSKKKTKK